MQSRHLFDAGQEIVLDPLHDEAVGSDDDGGWFVSIMRYLQAQRLDPGIELLGTQLFLKMFKTGKPKGIHCRHDCHC